MNRLKAVLLEAAAQEAGRFRIDDVSPIQAVRATDTPILLVEDRTYANAPSSLRKCITMRA